LYVGFVQLGYYTTNGTTVYQVGTSSFNYLAVSNGTVTSAINTEPDSTDQLLTGGSINAVISTAIVGQTFVVRININTSLNLPINVTYRISEHTNNIITIL
jgi:hypothetical protein